jgi:oligosaccharide repeat unit polymerase
MLVGALLLVYGPASLSFTLSSGEYGFLIRPLLGNIDLPSSMFPLMKAKIGDLDPVITAINFSLALMYLGMIAGIESINRLFPARTGTTETALAKWHGQSIQDGMRDHHLLLAVISALFLLMLFFSIKENHVGVIEHFFSIKGDNDARNVYRAHFGGSPNYLYRVILAAVAPMFMIWGLLAGLLNRSWLLLLAVFLLFLVTMIGKIETLSKAPPAFFLLQIMLAVLLSFSNRVAWRTALAGVIVVALVIYVTTRLIIIFPAGTSTIETVYSRIFEVENETLVENFAVFPLLHPFMWGANIRPIAMLMGVPYVPSFSLVAYTWYGNPDITSPTLFIADAWTDFSYAGVFLYSILAGAICRSIDIVFLARGKSVVAIAVLGATFWGVLTLITTALNIALFSGGLLLAPVLAAMLVVTTRYMTRPPDAVGRPAQ